MTYQLGVTLGDRLAAIAPQFGSFAQGFAAAPKSAVPVLDLHGSDDDTVPANYSLAGNGYYYTPVEEIFHGGKYSGGWMKANGCDGKPGLWPTKFDGQKQFWCIKLLLERQRRPLRVEGRPQLALRRRGVQRRPRHRLLLRWTDELEGRGAPSPPHRRPGARWRRCRRRRRAAAAGLGRRRRGADAHRGHPLRRPRLGCLDDEDAIVAGGGPRVRPEDWRQGRRRRRGCRRPRSSAGRCCRTTAARPTRPWARWPTRRARRGPFSWPRTARRRPAATPTAPSHCACSSARAAAATAPSATASHKHLRRASPAARAASSAKMDLGVCTYDAVDA